jgi:hypothetical protein
MQYRFFLRLVQPLNIILHACNLRTAGGRTTG